MYKDYISINGTTITSDEKGMHQIETTDKIAEELYLENEIELIELNINELNKEKKKLGSIKENKKTKKGQYIFAGLILLFVIALCKWIMPTLLGFTDIELPNPRFNFIHTHTDALLFTMIPTISIIAVPIIVGEILKCNRNIKEVLTLEEQLEFLSNELSKKREELESLKRNSKRVNITENNIHSIDNIKYKDSLQERLSLLWYIKKYRNKLKRHLESGTLLEQFRSLKIQPENFQFAEETLKRVLEKEKVTQHE